MTEGYSPCPACRQECDGFYEKLSENDFLPEVDYDPDDTDAEIKEDWLHADRCSSAEARMARHPLRGPVRSKGMAV